ncbi:RNA-binding ATPase activator ESF2 [Sporobolomyces salmoneus]|uniref:RNA-binding ATPase activator ESF2 n=1 Tax=Sporobolomyces salmoneus TaxID=183962 RepID=UPI00316AF964
MPGSSPLKASTSSTTTSNKKRKSVPAVPVEEDDRFSSFLSHQASDGEDPEQASHIEQPEAAKEDEDSLSTFPRQPLPSHLLPKHLSSTSSGTTTTNKKVKQPGLIYLSRIPPGMGPGKVKHLLSQFGEVGRIYLARADANKEVSLKKKFKQKERHQSHNFKEGWIEFLDKRVARSVAEMLNAQNIGGKKSDKWHDDVWTMKYLPRFRWDQLSEQVALERATQTSLMRFHLNHSKQEQESYLSAVEKARVSNKIEEKAASRNKSKNQVEGTGSIGEGGGGEGAAGGEKEGKNKRKKREFRQRQAVSGNQGQGGDGGNEEGKGERAGSRKQLDDVLGRLF